MIDRVTLITGNTGKAAGTLAIAMNRTRSAAIMTGRFRQRSMPEPSGTRTAAAVSPARPESIDTLKAEACRTRTATIGRAPDLTPLPAALTA